MAIERGGPRRPQGPRPARSERAPRPSAKKARPAATDGFETSAGEARTARPEGPRRPAAVTQQALATLGDQITHQKAEIDRLVGALVGSELSERLLARYSARLERLRGELEQTYRRLDRARRALLAADRKLPPRTDLERLEAELAALESSASGYQSHVAWIELVTGLATEDGARRLDVRGADRGRAAEAALGYGPVDLLSGAEPVADGASLGPSIGLELRLGRGKPPRR